MNGKQLLKKTLIFSLLFHTILIIYFNDIFKNKQDLFKKNNSSIEINFIDFEFKSIKSRQKKKIKEQKKHITKKIMKK